MKTKVKKTSKKVKKTKAVEPVAAKAPEKAITMATKQYIYDNMGKVSTAEIARNCQLTEDEVVEIAVSNELDVRPEDAKSGVTNIRRFAKHGTAIAMTASQSMLDDRERNRNVPSQEDINKQFGQDIQKIEIKRN